MKSILFVDDEQHILDGLRDLLRSKRREWQMSFASSGADALVELERQPFDVVVSDMRMPRMDGAALLRQVKERYPRVVRIMLSGQTEMEAALRSVPIAHQFLSKPCDAERLRSVIQRACDLQALLNDEELSRSLGGISSLPSVPKTYAAITHLLLDPEASLRELAALVETDMAISTRVLQVVNSAFFGLSRRLSSVQDAVSYLGINLVRNVVLTVEAFRDLHDDGRSGLDVAAIQWDCVLTGRIARRLLTDPYDQQDAFTAGTLHDVGCLVLATRDPGHYAQITAEARARGLPRAAVERAHGGPTHAEVGAYLLGLWGLPYGIVEAVAHHHAPARMNSERFGVVEAVACAASLEGEITGSGETLDPVLVERFGLAPVLPKWRAIARSEFEGMGP